MAAGRWCSAAIWCAPLLFLWQEVIRHLSLEWSLNAQYRFGWALPVLCLFLFLRNARNDFHPLVETKPTTASGFHVGLTIVLAACYAPIHLIEEANPDWRMVSWALALNAIVLTLVFILTAGPLLTRRQNGATGIGSVFPIVFFLTAVPWPTGLERPVVVGLTRIVTLSTTEFLSILGVPSICHGQVIELGPGMVGVDEACSGIRSIQVCLMLSFFFGEVYRLSIQRRVGMIPLGLFIAVGLNVVRTTVLSWIRSRASLETMSLWYEWIGTILPVLGFAVIWLAAFGLRPTTPLVAKQPAASSTPELVTTGRQSTLIMPAVLLLWLVSVYIGTECWFRFHEKRLPPANQWTVAFPRRVAGFCERPFSAEARRILRFDEGIDAVWPTPSGLQWQAIYLRWNPGRIAAHLARNHTPSDCLRAAGKHLLQEETMNPVNVRGLDLPFRCYTFSEGAEHAYAFYCLWEDRGAPTYSKEEWLTVRNRLRAVIAGDRNCGQRSLELIVHGPENEQTAQEELEALLQTIIVPEQ